MDTSKYQRIGTYPVKDIKVATVVVELKDKFGIDRIVPFRFRGETGEHGQHCRLYMGKDDVEALSSIKPLQQPYSEGESQNVYIFEMDEVYVKSEDNIYYESSYR